MSLASLGEDNFDKKLGPVGWGVSNGLVTRCYINRHTQFPLYKRSRTGKTKDRKTTVKMEGSAYSSRG
jgi:hypothetical protein